jgi:hypothetical protein
MDTKQLLAVITLAGFLLLILGLFFIPIPTGNMDLLKTFGVALIAIVTAVAGYYFGSSEGSARKTEIMSTAPPATPDPNQAAG